MNISDMEWQILYTLVDQSLRTKDIAEEIERDRFYVSSYISHLKKKKLIERDTQALFGIRFKISALGITHLKQRGTDLANESAKIQRLVGSPRNGYN
jgi:predicted transcriptional regulator